MVACLMDGLADLYERGIPPYAMFNGTGPDRLTLKQLREG